MVEYICVRSLLYLSSFLLPSFFLFKNFTIQEKDVDGPVFGASLGSEIVANEIRILQGSHHETHFIGEPHDNTDKAVHRSTQTRSAPWQWAGRGKWLRTQSEEYGTSRYPPQE